MDQGNILYTIKRSIGIITINRKFLFFKKKSIIYILFN